MPLSSVFAIGSTAMTTWQWRSVAKRSLERAPRLMYPAPRLLEPSVVEGTLGRFDTACGPMWLPIDAPDDVIVRDIRAGKLFEGPVIRTLLPFIRPGAPFSASATSSCRG